ncbi:hypothetical protein HMPREF0091_10532 [Fannyhessea vaginae DSM 15829]|uniref:Uncharacterized protein n=1 Tax=Fannyhessea vaginae DSM 15829 TaxID=525256 RepID=F1T4E1_9ACTN|nr:hypothetical protein HMPREF0091_10532 [Fannyhessea vaginae DSM 15829]
MYNRNVAVYKDHPRVCGKNAHELQGKWDAPGSPPRMREKPLLSEGIFCKLRITPAYAGKTSFV